MHKHPNLLVTHTPSPHHGLSHEPTVTHRATQPPGHAPRLGLRFGSRQEGPKLAIAPLPASCAAQLIHPIWVLFIVSIRSCRVIKTMEAISEVLQELRFDAESAE